MRIAVASGKGGTGKTTVSVALALANRDRVRLLDCDVEEPNAHLFLRGRVLSTAPVMAGIPRIDPDRCTGCGNCADFCRFNAIAMAGTAGPIVFPELCHDCGGCALICPVGAISECEVARGAVEASMVGDDLELLTGRLDVGNPSAPTVIRAVIGQTAILPGKTDILDSPPGTACSFAATVRDADHCLLVTDPTPFGLHDLDLAVEALKEMGKPHSVIVNRSTGEHDPASVHCREAGIPVMLRIPEDRRIAETISRGGTLLDTLPSIREDLRLLLDRLATVPTAEALP